MEEKWGLGGIILYRGQKEKWEIWNVGPTTLLGPPLGGVHLFLVFDGSNFCDAWVQLGTSFVRAR